MSDPILFYFFFFAISFQQCILCRQPNLVRKIAPKSDSQTACTVCMCGAHTVGSNGL